LNRTSPLTLVILAAGIGSRFGGAKQVEPVGPSGEYIVDYSVYDALASGFTRIVFVVKEGMGFAFKERFTPLADRCDLLFVPQRLDDIPDRFTVPPGRTKPWGTAHALLACRGELDGPFGVINADDFYGRSGFVALAHFLSARGGGREGCLIGYRLDRTLSAGGPVSRGVCRVDRSGYLVEVVERNRVMRRGHLVGYEDESGWHEIPGGAIASMNMWGLPLRFLDELERGFPPFLSRSDPAIAEYQLPGVIGEGVQEGRLRIRVIRTEEEWFGLTYPEDLTNVRERIKRLIEDGAYPPRLFG